METKTIINILLNLILFLTFVSCTSDEAELDKNREDDIPEETTDSVAKPLIVTLQQTDSGYAPVVEPILAETFLGHFSKGGWGVSGSKEYHVLVDGTITTWDIIGKPASGFFFASDSTLLEVTYGIRSSGQAYGMYEHKFTYNEKDNAFTIYYNGYNERDIPFDITYTIVSISEEEMHCTTPRSEVEYEMMWANTEPYVLEYIIFHHSNVTIEDVLTLCATQQP